MQTFFLTVVLVIAIGLAVLQFGPQGWRTHIFHAIALAVPGAGALMEQMGGIDWSKFIDQPKVVYGLAVGIPMVAMLLRQKTTGPVGG